MSWVSGFSRKTPSKIRMKKERGNMTKFKNGQPPKKEALESSHTGMYENRGERMQLKKKSVGED